MLVANPREGVLNFAGSSAERSQSPGAAAFGEGERPLCHPPQDELGSDPHLRGTTACHLPAPPNPPLPQVNCPQETEKVPRETFFFSQRAGHHLRRVEPIGRSGHRPVSYPDEGVRARAPHGDTHTPAQHEIFRPGAPRPPPGPRGCVPERGTEG